MVPALDSAYIARMMERLARLSPGARPGWGAMRSEQLIPHFIGTFETSLGRHPTGLPFTGILITEAARDEGGYLLN